MTEWTKKNLIDLQEISKEEIELILEKSELLVEFPDMGYRMNDDSGRRELIIPFRAGAYVLRYYLLKEYVVVVRVWHSRENRDRVSVSD